LWKPADGAEVLFREQHEVWLRLGAGYPRMMPEIVWRTPIFHPNISANGVVCLGGYSLHWVPSLQLDELCVLLWDIIRYQNYDVKSPYNRAAARWAQTQQRFAFPLDPRPLRDRPARQGPWAVAKSWALQGPARQAGPTAGHAPLAAPEASIVARLELRPERRGVPLLLSVRDAVCRDDEVVEAELVPAELVPDEIVEAELAEPEAVTAEAVEPVPVKAASGEVARLTPAAARRPVADVLFLD
jgi:hypothetical protein